MDSVKLGLGPLAVEREKSDTKSQSRLYRSVLQDLIPKTMGFGLKFTLAVLIAAYCLASPALAQLDSSKSWFLFSGQSPGKISLVSLTGVNNNITLPAHSESITVQSLTDIVNGRFLILSGITNADDSTLYTVRLSPSHPLFFV